MFKHTVFLFTVCVSFSQSISLKNYENYKGYGNDDLQFDAELILTPLIENGKLEEARKAAEVSHPEFLGVKSYSGYFTVNKKFQSNMFFWYFPAEENPENSPVVLWLQGGPGDSSLFGLFVENGPFEMKDSNEKITLRDARWTKNHSVLYIDNPVGAGYSYTKSQDGYVSDQTQVGNELYEAIVQFFTLFPDLQKNDFFVAGESDGGKFATALAYTIHKQNPAASLKINLKGLAIDSSLVDPLHQHKYADYLYQIGLIDEQTVIKFKELEANMTASINSKDYENALVDLSLITEEYYTIETGLDTPYNFLEDEDTTVVLRERYTKFLRKPETRLALHVGENDFLEDFYETLYLDLVKSVSEWITELIANYRVLFYNGQLDVVTAYPLLEDFLQNLQFKFKDEYEKADRKIWELDGDVAGYVKTAGNLQEALVRSAGHFIAHDQPKRAHDLISKFTRNELPK